MGFEDQRKQSCTCISEQVAQDVGYDDTCCCQLDVHASFSADQQDHCHGQNGKQQLVFKSSQSTRKSYCSMKGSEDVYYPGYSNLFHFTFDQKLPES